MRLSLSFKEKKMKLFAILAFALALVSCSPDNDLSHATYPVRVLSVFTNTTEEVGFNGTKFTKTNGFSTVIYVDATGRSFTIQDFGIPQVTPGQQIELPKAENQLGPELPPPASPVPTSQP